MENIWEDPKKRKIMIAITAGIFIIGISFIINIILTPTKPEQTNANITPTEHPQNDSGIKPPDTSSIKSNPKEVPQMIPGEAKEFIISYPSDWKPEISAIAGGGTSVTLRPKVTQYDVFPRIEIEGLPSTPTMPLSKRIESFSWMKLKKSTVVFHGVRATMLDGNPPLSYSVKGVKLPKIHKTFLLFEENGFTYNISYAYFEDKTMKQNKAIFKKILDSFTSKKPLQ